MNLKKRLTITFISLMSLPVILMITSIIVMIVYRNPQVSRSLVVEAIWVMVIILIIYAILLTTWVNRGVFLHIRELNTAMDHISEGDFDYVLDASQVDGEFAELFKSYEDMRLRLKESSEDRLRDEAQNRELISNITHDLKTPITSIKGYAEGIIDGVADTDEKKDRYIRTIYDKTKDLDRLLNELTYYSSIDNNKIPYNFHRIDVGEFFADCVEEVGIDLENKDIELIYENLLQPGTRIIADPIQLRKVINNIIGNSVKYMNKSHGEISIRLLDAVDSVRIEIEDNGKGIASKDLSNIFERFYRTDASRNSAQGGSGIGLSIVRKIIEDHGGYIWATSKEGEGTCMHFVIRKYIEVPADNSGDENNID
ncbi:MAG: HAMP domain-containing histidine kinase [Lachnospiraceae bacterium]|nr:HAMP domain-containing histidine kinase [Candidatus Colinaster scatohippi]